MGTTGSVIMDMTGQEADLALLYICGPQLSHRVNGLSKIHVHTQVNRKPFVVLSHTEQAQGDSMDLVDHREYLICMSEKGLAK